MKNTVTFITAALMMAFLGTSVQASTQTEQKSLETAKAHDDAFLAEAKRRNAEYEAKLQQKKEAGEPILQGVEQ